MEIWHFTVIVYVHENGIWPFQGLLILRNINMTLLKKMLREPVSADNLYKADTWKGPEDVRLVLV